MKKFFILTMFFFVTIMTAQNATQNIDEVLTENTQSVQNIIATIKTWIYWIIGLSFIVYLALSVLGGQEGGDKTKKMGAFFMYLAFVGIGLVVIASMFGI